MSGHTPGPWGHFGSGIYSAAQGAVHSGKTCAECGHDPTECGDAVLVAMTPTLIDDVKTGCWDDMSADETPRIADLQLMATAPELLSLLQELIDIEGPQPGHIEWARKVQAAIAKATQP